AGGGPDSGRRGAAEDARVFRVAESLPVCREVRTSGEGQRQGQSRGTGGLRAAQLPGAGSARGELGGVERAVAERVPGAASAAATRPPGDDRRALRARPGGISSTAGQRPRSLREAGDAGQFDVVGTLPHQRLLGADRVWTSRRAGEGLRTRGGDRLRQPGDRPTPAQLPARRHGLRSAALSGLAGAEGAGVGPGGAAVGLGVAGVFRAAAAAVGGAAEQGRQTRVRAGAASAGGVLIAGSRTGGRGCVASGHDRLRCRQASAAVPHRAASAAAGPGELSAPAAGRSTDHAGRRLHDLAPGADDGFIRDIRGRGDAMSDPSSVATADTPQVLLEHHLKQLRLPTFLREYDKVARQCASESADYPRYLLRLTEQELLDRERRATERRIHQARFPVVKSLDTFEFMAIPAVNKALVLELARCEFLLRRENVLLLGNSGTG